MTSKARIGWNKLLIFLALTLITLQTHGQEPDTVLKGLDYMAYKILYKNHDTSYIKNYSERISVKLLSSNKYNYFTLRDNTSHASLRYRPVRNVSLGLGVAHKWFALDLTFSLGLRERSEFENTTSFDFQSSIFSSKQFISLVLQYYQAYQIENMKGVPIQVPDTVKRREDIRTIHLGLQYMFAVNYTKFSIKAPFVLNESQRKSAGSPIVGATLNLYVLNADSSVVPNEAKPYMESHFNMTDFSCIIASASLGYMYSFVYNKRFFLTVSLIPGLNINAGDYFTNSRQYFSPNIHLKIKSMNAIGYNSRKFYGGIQFVSDLYFSRLRAKTIVEIGHGKLDLFVGYRFKWNRLRDKFKKMK